MKMLVSFVTKQADKFNGLTTKINQYGMYGIRERVSEVGMNIRENCEHRHTNGNCLFNGGFCLANDEKHCVRINEIKSYNQALEDFEECAIQQSLYTAEEGWSGMTIDTKTIKSIKAQLKK